MQLLQKTQSAKRKKNREDKSRARESMLAGIRAGSAEDIAKDMLIRAKDVNRKLGKKSILSFKCTFKNFACTCGHI